MKETLRKIVIFAVTIVVAAVVSACGTVKAPETAGVGEYPESPFGEATEPEEAAAFADNPDNSELEIITGTVVYYDGATLMVCSEDYRSLNFLVAGDEVDKSGADELERGSGVDVYYMGIIEGGNTSAVQVAKLVQSAAQSKVSADVNLVGGIILKVGGETLTMVTFDGDELTFPIDDSETDKSNTKGLETGDYVTVFYTGEIIDNNAVDVAVVRLVQ